MYKLIILGAESVPSVVQQKNLADYEVELSDSRFDLTGE